MGQLMNIVMPILLIGGAIFVFSKKCELLGMCGDKGEGDEAPVAEEKGESTTTETEGTKGGESSSKVETPSAEKISQDVNKQVAAQTPTVEEIMKKVNEQLASMSVPAAASSSSSSSSGSGSSSNCCKCRKESNGDVRCQRHGKGNWTRYESAKKDMAGAMRICTNGCNKSNYTYRSYFVDPNYVRPFYLYHRIGNIR